MYRLTVTTISLFLITVSVIQTEYAIGSENSKEEQPLYKQVLALLKDSDSVKPKELKAHPVSTMYNREAIIPPQCYTKTEGKYNPCYVCHQDAIPERENVMNDADIQQAYSFSDVGLTNHWKNLFEDRSKKIASISDSAILDWINQDNYSELEKRLKDSGFKGWIPDIKNLHLAADAFDQQGFAKDGTHWVAFNYKPMPSTFWPTNGSTDDVMIRLPAKFRNNKNNEFSADVYKANLAIVEANVKGLKSISALPVDEKILGKDLNQDKRLTKIDRITDFSTYVGAAEKEYKETHLYPEGTEFLHTVRYIGFNDKNEIVPSRRMKEVRYMKKWRWYPKVVYARQYELEGFEKEAGHLPGYQYIGDHGLDNGNGWAIQGFIEDKNGRLRVSTYEENFFCMGCHNSIGSTIDKTFSFPRKVDGAAGWGYINLKGMPDVPNMGETKGEILTYFERAGGGDEFRSNTEITQRFFNKDRTVNYKNFNGAKDIYDIVAPSRERALQLNKAYKTIVMEQDFMFGRDATVMAPVNVYDKVDNEDSPTLPESKTFKWDIRLDWSKSHSTIASN